jgi:hypothetical protein
MSFFPCPFNCDSGSAAAAESAEAATASFFALAKKQKVLM